MKIAISLAAEHSADSVVMIGTCAHIHKKSRSSAVNAARRSRGVITWRSKFLGRSVL